MRRYRRQTLHTFRRTFFFFKDTATTEIYTLSLHDALPISVIQMQQEHRSIRRCGVQFVDGRQRSEEHTSELQSRLHLVCRLLLEKKKELKGIAAPVGAEEHAKANNYAALSFPRELETITAL